MKKLFLVLALAVTLLFLCSCVTAPMDQIYNVNEDGSGTFTLNAYFMHDYQFEPWDLDMSNAVVESNDVVLPAGSQAAIDYLNTVKPDYVTLSCEVGEVYDILTMTVAFDNVDDFNAKAQELAGDMWKEHFAATMEITDNNGQRTITFGPSFPVGEPMLNWAFAALRENPEVFNENGNGQDTFTAVKSAKVTVAGKTESWFDVMDDSNWGNGDSEVNDQWLLVCTVANTFAYDAPASEEVVETPVVEEPVVEAPVVEAPVVEETVEAPVAQAPQTFDAAIIAAVAAVVSLAGYAVSKKR